MSISRDEPPQSSEEPFMSRPVMSVEDINESEKGNESSLISRPTVPVEDIKTGIIEGSFISRLVVSQDGVTTEMSVIKNSLTKGSVHESESAQKGFRKESAESVEVSAVEPSQVKVSPQMVVVALQNGHVEMDYNQDLLHTIRHFDKAGQLHCDYGPAVTAFDNTRSSMVSHYYWLHGVQCSMEEWLLKTGNHVDVVDGVATTTVQSPTRSKRF